MAARCRIHKQIEVVGFTQEQIKEYARVVFASQPDVLADFLTYISTYPAVRSMMYIPMNSAIVVEMYGYNRTASRPIPQTMTQLYVELSLTLLKRHLGEDDPLANEVPLSLEDLPSQLYEPFRKLAEFAFEGLVRNEVVFHKIPDGYEHFGFMNSPTNLYLGRKVSMSCSFLHLTLQEFLAAFYISQLSPSDQENVYYHTDTGSWDVVWTFVAGLTGFSGIGWEVVEAERGRANFTHILGDGIAANPVLPFLVKCLYEAQEKVDYDLVLKESEVAYVFRNKETALDCYTLGYCVGSSKCMWKLDIGDRKYLGGTIVEMLKHGLYSCIVNPPHRKHAKFNIIVLNIRNCNLNSTAFDHLAEIIPLMTKLVRLTISENPVGEGGLVKLFHALSCLKNLRTLNMFSITMGFKDFEAFSHLITPTSCLKELEIGSKNMSDECTELMLKTVLSPSSLVSVTFDGVADWTDHAKKLLEENKNIVQLVQVPVFPSLKTICKALHKNCHLKELILGFNNGIDETQYCDTMSLLSTMLESNNSLECVFINGFIMYELVDCRETGPSRTPFITALTNLNNALQTNHTLKLLSILDLNHFNVTLDPRIKTYSR